MGKKLIDIEQNIHDRSDDFYKYLNSLLPIEVKSFLDRLSTLTNVFLFSGVTRNFFLNRKREKVRDIDFIIEDDVDIQSEFPTIIFERNNFGGYKLIISELTIDLWVMHKTWGLNYGQLTLKYSLLESLPATTFFNFSSIVFSINKKEFIIGKPFLTFLLTKKLDVVLEDNPLPELCIVNSFYYSERFKLKLSKKLIAYIINKYESVADKTESIQIKHFGELKYKKDELSKRVNKLKQAVNPPKDKQENNWNNLHFF